MMKKVIVFIMTIILFIACQEKEQRYFSESPEINTLKAGIAAYEAGDWTTWRGHFADTAKIYVNSDESISVDARVANLQEMSSAFSKYGFDHDEEFIEMVLDKEKETWVYYWAQHNATIAGNNKELSIPVHLAVQFVNGKIAEEHVFFDGTELNKEIEALTNMPADQKLIDEKLNSFVNKFHNQGDASVMDDILAPRYARYMNGVKAASNAKELTEGFKNSFRKGFPDMKLTNPERIYHGNKVYVHWNFKGTNTGEFNGVPATGKKVDVSGLSELHFNGDGKLYMEKVFFNELDMMSQLGYTVAPPN